MSEGMVDVHGADIYKQESTDVMVLTGEKFGTLALVELGEQVECNKETYVHAADPSDPEINGWIKKSDLLIG